LLGLTELELVEITEVKPAQKMLRFSAWQVAGLGMGLRRFDIFKLQVALGGFNQCVLI
jgi:hypothetical protein